MWLKSRRKYYTQGETESFLLDIKFRPALEVHSVSLSQEERNRRM